MLRRAFLAIASLVAIAAVFWSLQANKDDHGRDPQAPSLDAVGRNNTVLIITAASHGLSNVHVATSYALLERHPDVEVHFASFGRLESELERISQLAQRKTPSAKPVRFHRLSQPDVADAMMRQWKTSEGIVSAPGLGGIRKLVQDMELSMAPWETQEYLDLYEAVRHLILEVDPAIILLDLLVRPASDVIHQLRRPHAIVSPNGLTDIIARHQPRGAMFWKYPALGSGYPFPLPWYLIPANIYLHARLIIAVLFNSRVEAKRDALRALGIENPINSLAAYGPDVPWIMTALPEASWPVEVIPPNVFPCGPIVLDFEPAEVQDPVLTAWAARAPTLLVNLGSVVKYTEKRATAMALAIAHVMEHSKSQVIWKFRKAEDFDDSFLEPLKPYIQLDRVRMESWLSLDPASLLKSGQVAVSVHHGGANCFFEAVRAGVPQVILPLWIDLYGFARTAEYLGIGIWPGEASAPSWDAESLGRGFIEALEGPSSESMRGKARALGEVARTYGGRDSAADIVAGMAAKGA